MATPHKYADVIKHWAEGGTIQNFNEPDQKWIDCGPESTPIFSVHIQWRIKPKVEYPETKMHEDALIAAYDAHGQFVIDGYRSIANAAIRAAIDCGDVIIPEKG